MKREFFVFIEKDEDGFFVGEVPQIRACYAQGRTLDELMENITEVIEMCIEEEHDMSIHSAFVGVQKVLIDDKTAYA
ncbi:MAG TPA: type II toxin-antitoxin system HicB family antitoxin [Desulfobacterales bacterium]|nr:MAG: type II toxin-antitoxin system HicB family antitoxin [Deltaproteobacteria bacterium]HHC24543.1 type II toxin-antitoxin system HicB family antitoxin [Desulfobacterales bacterium]